jgi:TPR repeat protein
VSRRIIGVSWGAVLLTAGCGGAQSVAGHVRPQETTAAQALGEPELDEAACLDVSRGGRPLVVDLKPEQRGDLEVSMSQGIAIVGYDCKGLTLLPDCSAEGSYGFKGVVLKQQVIRLSDADEIKTNLPLSGATLAAKLEAELERGTTLDLATALVGNVTSTRMRLDRSELVGMCTGATHFVRAANIGAFAMQTGTEAEVASAAQVFGVGASGGSQSSKLTRVEDGRLEECRKANPDSAAPPGNCQALIRLRLLPILAEAAPSAAAPVAATPPVAANAATVAETDEEDLDEEVCPEGLVFSEGKCVAKEKTKLHVCDPANVDECRAECEKNEPTSCAHYARALKKGTGITADLAAAAKTYGQACELDHAGACSELGILTAQGQGVPQSDEQAVTLFERACQLGEANGCFNLGTMYYDGIGVTKDAKRAFELFEQACNAGKAAGCINVGIAYDDGDGVEQNPQEALKLFKRACEGDEPVGCFNLAFMHAKGSGTTVDQGQATRYYDRACELGHAKGCEQLARRYLEGNGVEKDEAKAAELKQKACELGEQKACP